MRQAIEVTELRGGPGNDDEQCGIRGPDEGTFFDAGRRRLYLGHSTVPRKVTDAREQVVRQADNSRAYASYRPTPARAGDGVLVR